MSKEPNVRMTAEAIDEMATQLDHYADELRRTAKQMRDRNDIEYANEAIHTIRSMFSNLRIDLLIIRPIREYQKLLRD